MFDTLNTKKKVEFVKLLVALYSESELMGKQRISWLYSLFRTAPTQRFHTYACEIAPLVSRLQGTSKPLSVEDIGSGGKGIVKAMKTKYPGAIFRTLDIDNRVRPDICANFLNPSTYAGTPRPDLLVTRYVVNLYVLSVDILFVVCRAEF